MATEHLEDVDEDRLERHPEVVRLLRGSPREVVAQIDRDLGGQPPELVRWAKRAVLMGMIALRRGRR